MTFYELHKAIQIALELIKVIDVELKDKQAHLPIQAFLTEELAQLARPCGCKTCLGCRAWAELQYRKK